MDTLITVPAGTFFTAENVTSHGSLGTREGVTKSTNTIFEAAGSLTLGDKTVVTGASTQLLHMTGSGSAVVEKGASLNVTDGNGITCDNGTVDLAGTITGTSSVNELQMYGIQMTAGTLKAEETGTITKMRLSGIRADGGAVELYNASITGNGSTGVTQGGGLYLGADIELKVEKNSTLSGNSAASGGGLFCQAGAKITPVSDTVLILEKNSAVNGGGLYIAAAEENADAGFTLDSRFKIVENSATNGGAVYGAGGIITYDGTAALTDNTATADGADLYVGENATFKQQKGAIGEVAAEGSYQLNMADETVDVTKITLRNGNSPLVLNGAENKLSEKTFPVYVGLAFLNNCTISGNSAEGEGGGIYVGSKSDVTISGDTTVSDNTASQGGGLYLDKGTATVAQSSVTLGDMTINGNHSTSDSDNSSGVYVGQATANFQGSRVKISDVISLNDKDNPLILTDSMHRGVTYRMSLGGNYDFGNVVVKLGGDLTNAAQYLRYTLPIKAGTVFVKGKASEASTFNDAIVMEKCVFIDGENGDDSNDGSSPDRAVKTMNTAIASASG